MAEPASQAWIELPDEEELRAQGTRWVYDFGTIPGMGRLMTAHGRIGAKFGPLYYEIMFKPGALSRLEREMVAAVASAAQDCHY